MFWSKYILVTFVSLVVFINENATSLLPYLSLSNLWHLVDWSKQNPIILKVWSHSNHGLLQNTVWYSSFFQGKIRRVTLNFSLKQSFQLEGYYLIKYLILCMTSVYLIKLKTSLTIWYTRQEMWENLKP